RVDFSPDSRFLGVADSNQIVRVWELDRPGGPVQTLTLSRESAPAHAVLFGPEGHTLLVASPDEAIDVVDLDAADMARRLCQGAGEQISEAEWPQSLPRRPYDPGCP